MISLSIMEAYTAFSTYRLAAIILYPNYIQIPTQSARVESLTGDFPLRVYILYPNS